MSDYTNRTPVSWDEIHRDSVALVEKLRAEFAVLPAKILAVTRGGLVPASIIAHSLGIKDIETIGLESHDGQKRGDRVILSKIAHPGFMDDALVIDDLVDTGKTLAFLRPLTENCVFATLYAKPMGEPYTDCFMRSFSQETWVDFPWEV